MPTLPSNATRDAARTAHARTLAVVAELDLDRCSNSYGVSPCTAGRTHTGTAQAGAEGTLTLAAGASGSDDTYNGMWLRIHTGAASAQERKVLDYVGSTKVATVSPRWRSNLLKRSEAIDHADWSNVGTPVVTAADGTSADGIVWTKIEDNDAGAYEGRSQSLTVANDSATHVWSCYIKKSSGGTAATVGININLTGGTSVNLNPRFNTDTGAVLGGSATVESLSDAWRVSGTITNNTTGNTTLTVALYPATAAYGSAVDVVTATGSAWFGGVQVEKTTSGLGEYIQTTSAAIAFPDNTSQYHVIDRAGACYNTRITCQDKPNYVKGVKTYSFGLRGAPIPPGVAARPTIMDVDAATTVIDPEAGLARRNSLKLTLSDTPDSDLDQDPYAADRTAAAQGTWWRRLIARNPNMAGRPARVRRGYVVAPWDWDTFLDELYLIERVDGPSRDGRIDLVLKDPLKLTDRTKVPVATDGKLTAELKAYADRGTLAGATSTTAVLAGSASSTDDVYNGMELYISGSVGAGQRRTITDYVGETRTATVAAWVVVPGTSSTYEVSGLSITLTSGKGSQYADPTTSGKAEYVRIGEEVIRYTAKSTDTLSWPDATYRAQFGTTRKDAAAGAQVQLCRAFMAQPVTAVIQDILEEGGVDTAYIDTASLTAAEGDWYGEPFYVTCCLTEPTTANDLLGDLLPQIDGALWWSMQTQKAVFSVLLPKLASPTPWTDAANLIEGSVDVDVLEELRLTYAGIYYGHLSATANRSEAKNYALGEIVVDSDAESANEYDDRRTKVVYSRWFTAAAQNAMRAYVGRRIAALRDAPRKIKLQLDPKDYTLAAGELIDLTSRAVVDETGAPKTTRCLVTRIADEGTHVAVELRTTGFAKRYGFIAPNGTSDYPTDTTYAHITQNTGLMTNGDDGYLII